MKKTVSLVLSSGGARGVAHIGAIEELERQGFEIKSIAGTSMGAMVGGVYASGNLKLFRDLLCNLDKKGVINLLDFTLSTNGLVKGNKVINELRKIILDINIEDLPISYSAVATDIKHNKEIVFEKGSLYEAIRASISIPAFFTPVDLDEMILVDGAILNPLPIKRVKRSDNDLLIVIDVNAPFIEYGKMTNQINKKQLNYYTLLTKSMCTMIQKISAMSIELYKPDVIIKIPMNSYGSFHFYKSDEIIKLGEMATRKALLDFHNMKPQ